MSLEKDPASSVEWEVIRRIIQDNSRFLITTHVNADPDALGSELALAEGLRAAGKEAFILNPTETSRYYAFLDPAGEIRVFSGGDTIDAHFDAVFVLDISRWERLGPLADPVRICGKPKICVDHHPYTGGFSDHNLIILQACATAEIIYDLLKLCEIPLSRRIAECIYTSVLADTGAFTFTNTNARTHQIAGELLSFGICPRTLYENLYHNQTPERLRFFGKVLGEIQFDCNRKLAWMTVSHQMMVENGMTQDDLEGFVDLPRNCRSVLLSVLFLEVQPDDIKISLRSKGDFQSNSVAARFNGGGHAHASGIRLNGNLATVETMVLTEARKALTASKI